MVCYAPSTGTLAAIGVGIYILWHKTIGHLFGLFGTVLEVVVILGAEVGVAIFLVWLTRSIRRRRARSGACTTCRFRCQQALSARPNLLVNVVDRRVPAATRAATGCHPAAPLLPVRLSVAAGRVRPALLPALRRLRPAALTAPAVRAALPRGHGAPRFMGPVPAPFSVHGPVQAPPVSPLPPSATRVSFPAPAPVPAGVPVPTVPAAAPEPEAVDVDGYVLTPDGVDAPDGADAPGAQPASA